MDDLRKEKRAPILLKVKYKSASVDDFIQQSGLDISRGGIFIKTKTPMDVGTVLKLEFQLADGAAVIQGVGRVAWRRQLEVATRDLPPGMGVKFIKLDPKSRTIVDQTVSQRGAGPGRYDTEPEDGAESGATPPAAAHAAQAAQVAAPRFPSAPTAEITTGPALASPRFPSQSTGTAPAAGALKASQVPAPQQAAPAAKAGVRQPPPGVFSARGAAPAVAPAKAPSAPTAPAPVVAKPAAAAPAAAASAPDSFFPKGPPSAPPPDEDSTQLRHVSEFLASAMNEAGASDQKVAAEAQASVAKARQRESASELERLGALEAQLFGDMGESTVSVPLHPVSLAPRAGVERAFDPFSEGRGASSPEMSLPASPVGQTTMQSSLAPAAPEQAMARQAGFGAQPASASAAKFAAPAVAAVAAAPVEKPSGGGLWIALLLIGAIAGGGAYWYFQLGGAQQLAGTAPAPSVTPEPPTIAVAVPAEPEPASDAPTAAVPEPTPTAPPTPAPSPTPTSAPTPAPAATPTKVVNAAVQINVVPKDALVTIDGVAEGKGPRRVQRAVGSTLEISVSATGYVTSSRSVTVAERNDPVQVALESLPFVITVRADPPDAAISVGTQNAVHDEPLTIGRPTSPLTVTVTKPGYTKKQVRVTVDSFSAQDGKMVASLDVGLRRAVAAAPTATDAPASDGTQPDAPAPSTTTAEPAAPKPKPAPAPADNAPLPDNPF